MIEILEHTADVRLRITATSMEELFREALAGTMGLLQPQAGSRPVQRAIAVESAGRTTLLIDFLNEALSLAQVQRETYDGVDFDPLSDTRLVARLHGREARTFREDVKAVTYHEAEISEAKGVWSVTVVYDI